MGIMSEKENQIVVYQPNETVRLDVRLENETVWLTQLKIAKKSLVLIGNWATVETLICLRRAVKVCLAVATARKAA